MDLFQISFFLVIGIGMWCGSYFIYNTDLDKDNPSNEKLSTMFLEVLSVYIKYFFIIFLFVAGLLLILISIILLIFSLNDMIFSCITAETITYKDCLYAIIQIAVLLGSVITASFAYVFKKKSSNGLIINTKLDTLIKNNPKRRIK